MLLYLRAHLHYYRHMLRDLAVPLFLFIDVYYRAEWFELHTQWGKVILAPLFGGE